MLLEGGLVDSRHVGLALQVDAGDGEATFHLAQVDLGAGLDPARGEARLGQAVAKGHREAARVGGADQLFGVGAGAFFKTGAERVLALEGPASQLHAAIAGDQVAFPDGLCGACGHRG